MISADIAAKEKLNKLYFVSAIETWAEKDDPLPKYSWASEIVIARNDEWAIKMAFKQNKHIPKELWKIDKSYSMLEILELFRQKDHVIVALGASY